jgi:tellurite resistance protein TehA-like permease
MATGILSIDAGEEGVRLLSTALFVIAVAGYAGLVAIAAVRLYRSPYGTWDWLHAPEKGFGSLTFVAASGVLGARLVFEGQHAPSIALGLWMASAASWLALSYGLGATLIARSSVDPRRALTGTTFLTVVATQSLAGLSALLASQLQSDALALAAVSLWLLGAGLYAVLLTLLVARLIYLPFPASDFRPDSWVIMGALAITALAGTDLSSATSPGALLSELHPFILGLTVAAWASATFLIPLLLGGELWKVTKARPGRRYEPARWATVFPLGMYATASSMLGGVVGAAGLRVVGGIFFGIALAAWGLVVLSGFVAVWVGTRSSPPSDRSAAGRGFDGGYKGRDWPTSGPPQRGRAGVEARVRGYLRGRPGLGGDGPDRS